MSLKSAIPLILRISNLIIKLNIPVPLRVFNAVGHHLKDKGRWNESMDVFRKCTRHFPNEIDGVQGLAMVATQTKEWDIALENWNQVVGLAPHHEEAIYQSALCQIELKRVDEAKASLLKYVELYPDHHRGYEGMAHLCLTNFQKQEADQWLAKSILKTQAKTSYIKRAKLLIRHAQFDEGFKVLDQLICKDVEDKYVLLVKVDMLLMAGRYEDAVELVRSVYLTTPTREVKRLYAQALVASKRNEEACEVIAAIDDQSVKMQSTHSHHPETIIKYLKSWRKHYLEGKSSSAPKVFGIGLSRTGTSSLTRALEALGFDTLHFINPITKRILDLDDFYFFDAFTDSPVAYRFEELYTLFPDAKFIYTVRNLSDWVRSNSQLYEPMGFTTTQEMKAWFTQPEANKFSKLFQNYHPTYREAYESLYADFPTWEDSYHAFEQRVQQFFKEKPKDKLLTINICDGEGWEKLCTFLNRPIPKEDFPHKNKLTSSES